MINAFQKSKGVLMGIRGASLIVIIFLWIHDLKQGYPLYIPVVATVLMTGIGYFLSRLLGNLTASSENTKKLGLLHMELDPEAFIAAYRDIPAKLPEGSRFRAVSSSYLADGYYASGDPGQAVKVLDRGFETLKKEDDKKSPSLQGLYHGNRLLYLIEEGKIEEAKKEAEILERIITSCESTNKPLAENLGTTLKLRKARILIKEGTVINDTWLKGFLSGAHYNLLRLEIYRTIAENALLRGDKEEASEFRDRLIKESGKTCFGNFAKELLI